MRAGALRHRVTLQKPTDMQNSFGEVTRTWSDMATVWASIEPLRGRELLQARQVNATMTTRIHLRWRSDIAPTMRVVWSDPAGKQHIYNIVSIIHDKTHRQRITLLCQEVQS